MQDDLTAEQLLLANMKRQLPALEALMERARSQWEYEDFVYRFYHQSFKVFAVQSMTLTIVQALRDLLPDVPLNPWFQRIIDEGTGRTFKTEMNADWLPTTRPMVEAFFHARFMLEMVVKFAHSLDEPPRILPSGWAAVLHLYGLR